MPHLDDPAAHGPSTHPGTQNRDTSANLTAEQAERKLVGFSKVNLAAGKSKVVEFSVDLHQMEYWDTDSQSWKLGTGNRRF